MAKNQGDRWFSFTHELRTKCFMFITFIWVTYCPCYTYLWETWLSAMFLHPKLLTKLSLKIPIKRCYEIVYYKTFFQSLNFKYLSSKLLK